MIVATVIIAMLGVPSVIGAWLCLRFPSERDA